MATKFVTIPASGKTSLHGFSRAALTLCIPVNVINEEIRNNSLPGGLIMSPTLQKLKCCLTSHRIPIEVTNFSEHSVTIPAISCLCELHQVNLVYPPSPKKFVKLNQSIHLIFLTLFSQCCNRIWVRFKLKRWNLYYPDGRTSSLNMTWIKDTQTLYSTRSSLLMRYPSRSDIDTFLLAWLLKWAIIQMRYLT